MVVGRWMVTCGVRLRGVSGPKAPTELGKKSAHLYWRDPSDPVTRALTLSWPTSTGLSPPAARRKAALHSRSGGRSPGFRRADAQAHARPSASRLQRFALREFREQGQIVAGLEQAGADQRPPEEAVL